MRFHNVRSRRRAGCHVAFSIRRQGTFFALAAHRTTFNLKETDFPSLTDMPHGVCISFKTLRYTRQCMRRGNKMRRAQAPNIEYTDVLHWAAPAIFLQHRQQVGCHPFTLQILVVICLSAGLTGNWRCRQRRFSRSVSIGGDLSGQVRFKRHPLVSALSSANRAGQISL